LEANIVLLPGDGIGPEVVRAAGEVLEEVGQRCSHRFNTEEYPLGGIAIDRFGAALPEATLQACREADAVLLGAVGGPKWDNPGGASTGAAVRPEQGLLGLRKGMGLFANLRPVKLYPSLVGASPLRAERLAGVDLIVVRELTGGLYFGEPRLRRRVDGEIEAVDTMSYRQSEIRRVARVAFELAAARNRKLTSVDKANILECSRLWREVVNDLATEYPQVRLEHLLVDATAMYLVTRPASFDVMLTENMFGDILTDEASVLTGSMGCMPSASLGEDCNRHGYPRGLFEPIHGSAPDIAGRGIANPIGTVLSAAMLLRHSLGLEAEAQMVENAVARTLADGCRTADLGGGASSLTTAQMTREILNRLK
jgi:3-isopropylmalate dehydrogenase